MSDLTPLKYDITSHVEYDISPSVYVVDSYPDISMIRLDDNQWSVRNTKDAYRSKIIKSTLEEATVCALEYGKRLDEIENLKSKADTLEVRLRRWIVSENVSDLNDGIPESKAEKTVCYE